MADASYLEWNDAIAKRFFRPEQAGQEVWLYVTDDLIEEVGQTLSGGRADDFVRAVQAGPPWVRAHGLCQRAVQAYEHWRDRELEYPPYIGYLSLFVLAAGLEGDFVPHAYYPRLRSLLGDASTDAPASFDHMLELWSDLEQWSTRDREGSLGLFAARIVGNWIHVGLPIAQTILSEQERRALPGIFASADLDPTSPPPDEELVRALRLNGALLRPRSRALLNNRGDADSFAILIDTVTDELVGWDGTIDEESQDSSVAGRHSRFGVLRLCVRFERVSGRVSSRLRFKVRQEFPEDGVTFTDEGRFELWCDEGTNGWSSTLRDAGTDQEFDASSISWIDGFSLTALNLGWRLRLPGRRVRLFVGGATEGLPGLIETRQLPRGQPFYLLYQSQTWPLFVDWAEHECEDFRQLDIREGLPGGWAFASCGGATGDSRIRTKFPELAFPEQIRLSFVGGIRSAPGSNFFAFAPPDIALEGGNGTEEVTCAGRTLTPIRASRTYLLPRSLPIETAISIEATRGGKPVKRHVMFLTGAFDWRKDTARLRVNEWGEMVSGSDQTVGSVVPDVIAGTLDTSAFHKSVFLLPGIEEMRSPTLLFLGRMPGQIVSWPNESPTDEWPPIWAITLGRRRRVIYCGSNPESELPIPLQGPPVRERLALWKEVLWVRRKRAAPPTERCLATLWMAYVEAAHHA